MNRPNPEFPHRWKIIKAGDRYTEYQCKYCKQRIVVNDTWNEEHLGECPMQSTLTRRITVTIDVTLRQAPETPNYTSSDWAQDQLVCQLDDASSSEDITFKIAKFHY